MTAGVRRCESDGKEPTLHTAKDGAPGNVLEKIDESEYGRFAWVIDPEGNKVELRQPPAGQ